MGYCTDPWSPIRWFHLGYFSPMLGIFIGTPAIIILLRHLMEPQDEQIWYILNYNMKEMDIYLPARYKRLFEGCRFQPRLRHISSEWVTWQCIYENYENYDEDNNREDGDMTMDHSPVILFGRQLKVVNFMQFNPRDFNFRRFIDFSDAP